MGVCGDRTTAIALASRHMPRNESLFFPSAVFAVSDRWGMPWMTAFIWRLLFKNGALACEFCGKPFSKKAKTSLERHRANHIRRNALAYE